MLMLRQAQSDIHLGNNRFVMLSPWIHKQTESDVLDIPGFIPGSVSHKTQRSRNRCGNKLKEYEH